MLVKACRRATRLSRSSGACCSPFVRSTIATDPRLPYRAGNFTQRVAAGNEEGRAGYRIQPEKPDRWEPRNVTFVMAPRSAPLISSVLVVIPSGREP